MNEIQKAVTWAINIANNDSHGYDQNNRWGPDYDCSSLIISAWEQAGVPVKAKGATYTGNMKSIFLSCGFEDVTAQLNLYTGNGMKYGDVILNTQYHVVMYIGNGQIVSARINEHGNISGGKSGDQTKREIMIQDYYLYKYGWDCVLRYNKENTLSSLSSNSQSSVSNAANLISKGQLYTNEFVKTKIKITGKRDSITKESAIKVLQTALNKDYNAHLKIDGIWGIKTSLALGEHYVKQGESQYMVTAAEILLLLYDYDPNGVEIPGIFSYGLLSAIKTFQKSHNITVSGICDRKTFIKLIH